MVVIVNLKSEAKKNVGDVASGNCALLRFLVDLSDPTVDVLAFDERFFEEVVQ